MVCACVWHKQPQAGTHREHGPWVPTVGSRGMECGIDHCATPQSHGLGPPIGPSAVWLYFGGNTYKPELPGPADASSDVGDAAHTQFRETASASATAQAMLEAAMVGSRYLR